jgi:hypothetical protein
MNAFRLSAAMIGFAGLLLTSLAGAAADGVAGFQARTAASPLATSSGFMSWVRRTRMFLPSSLPCCAARLA